MFGCCIFEGYVYVCVFEQVSDFSYFWAVVGECSPDFFVFFFSLGMINFVLYLPV